MSTANSLKMLNRLHKSLLGTGRLEEKLKKITDGVVEIFNADFSRIWVAKPGDLCNCGCIHARAGEEKEYVPFKRTLPSSYGQLRPLHSCPWTS